MKEQSKKRLQTIKQDFFRGLSPDHLRLRSFQNKIEIEMSVGSYAIKTASLKHEVIASLRLRHEVFYEELKGKSHPTGLDIDRYDAFFDHLVVIDTKTEQVIATYRLYSSVFGEDFYSKSEFNLDQLSHLEGPFLEVGRSCVHKNYRKSTVLSCLWRGLSEYLKISKCRTMMGCASIKTEDVFEVAKLSCYFEKQNLINAEAFCEPLKNFKMPGLVEALTNQRAQVWTEADDQFAQKLIPPLFKSYLKAGATVSAAPAWDRDFKCVDYLIFLDTRKMDQGYEKRYL